jgi:Glycosyl hydrolase family 26
MARFEPTSGSPLRGVLACRAGGAVAVLLIALLGSLAAAAPSASASAAGVDRGAELEGRAPRISLSVPKEVTAEARALARGTIAPAHRGRVLLEVRSQLGWVRLAGARARTRKFRVAFVPPGGTPKIRIRAVLLQKKRRIAKSAARLILVKPGAKGNGSVGPGAPAYWGAWIGSQLTGGEPPWDMTAASRFEQMTGKGMSILEFSSPFADCSKSPCSPYEFPTRLMENIRQHGSIPLLSWASQATGNLHPSDFQLSDLIAGTYDSYIRRFAETAKAWGHPYFLRFDWEMNGPWFGWGEGANGNQPGEFKLAWRRVHDIFSSVGATNATWVWCPYVHGAGAASLASFYPGAAYVDWTCLDGYNWGTNPAAPYGWNSFDKLYGLAYRQVTETIAPGKPMMLGELASSEYGGSKAAWIREMFQALRTEYRNVRGLVWFEKLGNGEDWPLESSESALGAFAAGVQESRWAGSTFAGLEASPIPPP